MKAIMITYDQAHHENIIEALNHCNCRGFTSFGEVQGRGSKTGEPHYGSHAWPSMAQAIFTAVDNDRVAPLLEKLSALNDAKPRLGLRAFVWNIEQTL